jgi:hypothetical protein
MDDHPDHFYRYGDVYQALETHHVLEMNLTTLRRVELLSESEWTEARKSAAAIRSSLVALLAGYRRSVSRSAGRSRPTKGIGPNHRALGGAVAVLRSAEPLPPQPDLPPGWQDLPAGTEKPAA